MYTEIVVSDSQQHPVYFCAMFNSGSPQMFPKYLQIFQIHVLMHFGME